MTVYEFGDIQVDLNHLRVRRAGMDLQLEPKSFDVLRFLLEHRDRLVTKEELLDAVWHDTFVTPNVLTRAVAQLRKALGDEAREARIVETVAKRGYRFIADVTVTGDDPLTSSGSSGDRPVVRAMPAPGAAPSPGRARWTWIAALLTTAVVGGTVWLALVSRPSTGPLTFSPARRITTRAGFDAQPAISPDGKSIAYVSDVSGNLEIYVSGLVPGSRSIAITSDGRQNIQPSWSPDGQWIAYHAVAPGGVWIVPATGGQPRQIVETGAQPSWSEDSERLAYSADSGGMIGQSTIWTVRRDGSEARPFTKLGEPRGGQGWPSWSPDGKTIVFSVFTTMMANEIWTKSIVDGHLTKISTAAMVTHPRVGPGGDAIYWASLGDDGRAGISRIGLDARSGAADGPAEMILTLDSGRLNGLTIARDGTLAYAVETDDDNLWSLRVSADAGATEAPVRLTNDAVRAGHPDYSTDGRVVFDQVVVGQPAASWVIDENGQHRELVSDANVWQPVWARDASRVLAVATTDNVSRFIWVDLKSRRQTVAPVPPAEVNEIHNARLSPVSDEIAYHTVDDNGLMNVWIRPLDAGPARRITNDQEAMSYPSWSPDGKRLAVEIKRGETTRIGVVSREGGAVEEVVTERGQNWSHSWSPDGQWIAFAGQRAGIWNIYAVSARTREIRALTRFTSPSGWVNYPSWSPRGGRVIFERQIQSGSVWVLPVK
ncbi:MAG TPA: winged helix-turn-helix domain-containing protein [Vicinamibacterales bacterium]|nr:winged helix-turn-helix domain-containing protein [Vicinamibacterales bacterium]